MERLRNITLGMEDTRYCTEQDLRLYVWFHEILYNEILELGGLERGYTFRQRNDMCLLVYKVTFDGIPQVVFLTDHTPVRCIATLFRKLHGGNIKWVKDKFG